MLWSERLAVYVRIVASEPHDFLNQISFCVCHQIAMALIPHFIAMGERPQDALTPGFDSVFGDDFRVQRGQIAVPVNDLRLFAWCQVHVDSLPKRVASPPHRLAHDFHAYLVISSRERRSASTPNTRPTTAAAIIMAEAKT